jgi:hypothetical protein
MTGALRRLAVSGPSGHDSQLAFDEGVGQASGHLGLGLDHAGAHLGDAGLHFLFDGHGGGAADFCMGLGDEFVGLRLFGLEFGADVLADVHIGDVDREDFEGGIGIESLVENVFGDAMGVFEHSL